MTTFIFIFFMCLFVWIIVTGIRDTIDSTQSDSYELVYKMLVDDVYNKEVNPQNEIYIRGLFNRIYKYRCRNKEKLAVLENTFCKRFKIVSNSNLWFTPSKAKNYITGILILIVGLSSCNHTQKGFIPPNPIRIEIDVTHSPYNANGNDTLSDVDAFKLASAVASDLQESYNYTHPFDSLKAVLIVPAGNYIIDKSMAFGKTKMEFPPSHGIINITGSGISISGGTFIMR